MTIPFRVKPRWGFVVAASAICLIILPALWALDPCEHDRPKVCGGVTPGEGRVHGCMLEKIDQLSPECRRVVKKAEDLNQSMESLCAEDIQRYCSQYGPPGGARVIQCLKEKQKQLTPACRKVFDAYKALGYRVRQ